MYKSQMIESLKKDRGTVEIKSLVGYNMRYLGGILEKERRLRK